MNMELKMKHNKMNKRNEKPSAHIIQTQRNEKFSFGRLCCYGMMSHNTMDAYVIALVFGFFNLLFSKSNTNNLS